MDIKDIILIVLSAFNFIIAGYIYGRNRKSHINLSFSLMYLFAAFWSLGLALFTSTSDPIIVKHYVSIYYISAMLIAPSFLFFCIVYPFPSFLNNFKNILLIYIPAIIVSIMLLIPDIMIKGVFIDDVNQVELCWGYYIYFIVFVLYILIALNMLVRKYLKSDGVSKYQLKYIISGATIGFTIGIIFDLLFPLFGNYNLIWIGPYSSIVLMIFVYRLISKKA
jgi:hypothetical protein